MSSRRSPDLAVLLAGLALACGGSPGEGPCDRYADHPEVDGWCRVRGAGAAPDVEAWCGAAGRWEAECRAAWVEPRLRAATPSREVLLAACGGGTACALDVLDHRASGPVLDQLLDCPPHTGELVGHCVHHALQRWQQQRPSPAALRELATTAADLAPPLPSWVGFHLGGVVQCLPSVGCDDVPDGMMAQRCTEGAAAAPRGPGACLGGGQPGRPHTPPRH